MDKTPDANREARLEALESKLSELDCDSRAMELKCALAKLECAGLLLDLDRKDEAWEHARTSIEPLVAHRRFEDAATAFQYVYLADKDDAIPAIGQAAWLAVTYPINPHVTATILDHIIDETPDESDGAAVAAATAHYIADLRSSPDSVEELGLYTGAMLARVARRHSNVESQQMFELWVERLELDDPSRFLVRLRNVIDVMVQTDWWIDREALQAALPIESD